MILAPTDEPKALLKLFCLCSRTEAHLYGLTTNETSKVVRFRAADAPYPAKMQSERIE